MTNNPWGEIFDRIGEPAAMEQLAEECTELGHAALKIARIVRGENPARTTYEDAVDEFVEEYADVCNAIDVICVGLRDSKGIDPGVLALDVQPDKMQRWHDSLFGKENGNA